MLANLSQQHLLLIGALIVVLLFLIFMKYTKKKESFEEKVDPLSTTITYRYDLLDNILSNMNTYKDDSKQFVNVINGIMSLAFTCKTLGHVKLFSDCDFKGDSGRFDIGEYRLSDLINRGINNDSISSIKIYGRLAVILYEQDNFEGRFVVISSDDNCLNDNMVNEFKFNDQVSSIRVLPFPPKHIPTFDEFEHGRLDFYRNAMISLMFNLSEPIDAVVSLFTCIMINRKFDNLPLTYQNNKVVLGEEMFRDFNDIASEELKSNILTLEEYSSLCMKVISREFINNMVCSEQKTVPKESN